MSEEVKNKREEIINEFIDINYAYDDCTRLSRLTNLLDELIEVVTENKINPAELIPFIKSNVDFCMVQEEGEGKENIKLGPIAICGHPNDTYTIFLMKEKKE